MGGLVVTSPHSQAPAQLPDLAVLLGFSTASGRKPGGGPGKPFCWQRSYHPTIYLRTQTSQNMSMISLSHTSGSMDQSIK